MDIDRALKQFEPMMNGLVRRNRVLWVPLEDAMQNARIGLMKACRTFDGSSAAFSTWAYRCIWNEVVTGNRRESAQLGGTRSTAPCLPVLIREESARAVDNFDPIDGRDMLDSVKRVLPSREAIVLDRIMEGLTNAQIAEEFGFSESRAHQLRSRIRTKYRELMAA